jgi:NitT/TauT family transport system permease protein
VRVELEVEPATNMTENAVLVEHKPAKRNLNIPNQMRKFLLGFLFLLVVAVVWEGSKVLFALPDYKLPHLSLIVEAFLRPTPKGLTVVVLLNDALYTAMEAVLGFVIGGVAGFLLAVLFLYLKPVERGLLPWVIASQTVPIIAIAPMVVVGMGRLGAPPWLSKSVIAAYLTFFPVAVYVLRGLTSVDRDQLALLHSYAASRFQEFWKLRLPASVPFLFTALKISATASVVGAIIGELPVGSTRGLGVQLVVGSQYNTFNPGFLWATIIMAALLGLIFYGVVAALEWLLVRGQSRNDQ